MDADCPQCGHQTRTESSHCAQCGAALAAAEEGQAGFSLMHTQLPTPASSDSYQSGASFAGVDHEEDEMLGQQLGNFVLQEKIGEGGYGVVYRAEQVFLKQPFAIKILHLNKRAAPDVIERFRREALATAQLRHANVVQLADFGMLPQERGFYLVMELLEGQNLADALASGEAFPAARIRALIHQYCEVLHEAHELGIYHRDLKPGNTFLVPHRHGHDILKLLDFGVAAMMEEKATLTQTSAILGSPAYMSPEQSQGNAADLDGRSDLYSLGVILFELLTGRLPFEADTLTGMLFQHAFEAPPTLASANPNKTWAPALEAFLVTALAKSPAERPQDADSFAAACQEALDAQERVEAGEEVPLIVGPADTVASPIPEAVKLLATQDRAAAPKPRKGGGVLFLALLLVGAAVAVMWWMRQAPLPPPPGAHTRSPGTAPSITAGARAPASPAPRLRKASIQKAQPPPVAAPRAPARRPHRAQPRKDPARKVRVAKKRSLTTLLSRVHRHWKELLRRLPHLSPNDQIKVLHRIGHLRSQKQHILPVVARLLHHKQPKVRLTAFKAILNLRAAPSQVLPLFNKMIQDPDLHIRRASSTALAALHRRAPRQAAPHIQRHLQRGDIHTKQAILSRLRFERKLVEPLLATVRRLIRSPNRRVSYYASLIVKQAKQERARARKVRPRPNQPPPQHRPRRRSTKSIVMSPHIRSLVNDLDSPSRGARYSSIRALGALREKAAPALTHVLRTGSLKAKDNALRALRIARVPSTLGAIVRVLKTSIGRRKLVYSVQFALEGMRAQASRKLETEITNNRSSRAYVSACLFQLGRLTPQSVPSLLRLMHKVNEADQRRIIAALGICRVAHRQIFPHIVKALNHKSHKTRWVTVRAVSSLGGDPARSIRALEPLLGDPNERVRYRTIRSISAFRFKQPRLYEAALRKHLHRGPVRNQTAMLLGLKNLKRVSPKTRKAIEGLLQSPNIRVSRQARFTLRKLDRYNRGGYAP